jgi:hypothetical protein
MNDNSDNSDNSDNISKLKVMFINEKLNHGLIGFHFSVGMTSDASVEDIAKEIIEMHEAYLDGKFVDITHQIL